MHTDDGDRIIGDWIGAVEGNVLFNGELDNIFLAAAKTVGMFADVLPWESMLHYLEGTHSK